MLLILYKEIYIIGIDDGTVDSFVLFIWKTIIIVYIEGPCRPPSADPSAVPVTNCNCVSEY